MKSNFWIFSDTFYNLLTKKSCAGILPLLNDLILIELITRSVLQAHIWRQEMENSINVVPENKRGMDFPETRIRIFHSLASFSRWRACRCRLWRHNWRSKQKKSRYGKRRSKCKQFKEWNKTERFKMVQRNKRSSLVG